MLGLLLRERAEGRRGGEGSQEEHEKHRAQSLTTRRPFPSMASTPFVVLAPTGNSPHIQFKLLTCRQGNRNPNPTYELVQGHTNANRQSDRKFSDLAPRHTFSPASVIVSSECIWRLKYQCSEGEGENCIQNVYKRESMCSCQRQACLNSMPTQPNLGG